MNNLMLKILWFIIAEMLGGMALAMPPEESVPLVPMMPPIQIVQPTQLQPSIQQPITSVQLLPAVQPTPTLAAPAQPQPQSAAPAVPAQSYQPND